MANVFSEFTRTRPLSQYQTPTYDMSGRVEGYFQAISATPEFCNKSFEELRWEDYQVRIC